MKPIYRTNDIKWDLLAVGCLLVLYIFAIIIDIFVNNPFKRKTTYSRKRICNWTVVGIIKSAQLMTMSILVMIAYSKNGNSALDTSHIEFDILQVVAISLLPFACQVYGHILEKTGARLYLFINCLIQSITCFAFGTILLKFPHSYEGQIFLYFFYIIIVVLSAPTEIALDKINAAWYKTPRERAIVAGLLPILGIFNYIGAIITRYTYFTYVGSPSLLYACSLVLLTVSIFSFFIQNTPQTRDYVKNTMSEFQNVEHQEPTKEPKLLNASFTGVFFRRWFIYILFVGILLYGAIGDYHHFWLQNILYQNFKVDITSSVYYFGSISYHGLFVTSCILFGLAWGFGHKYLFFFTFVSFFMVFLCMSAILGLCFSQDPQIAPLALILSFLIRFFKEGIMATKRYYSQVIGGYKWTARLSALFDSAYYIGFALSCLLVVLLRPSRDFSIVIFNSFGVAVSFFGSLVFLFLCIYKIVAFKVYKVDFENKDRF